MGGKGSGGWRKHDWALILETFHRLGTQLATARHLHIHQSQVSKVLLKSGIAVGQGNRPELHTLPWDDVIQMYRSGMYCREIGAQFGVDEEYIRDALARRNIPRRNRGFQAGTRNQQWKGGRSHTVHFHRRRAYEVAAICLGQPTPQGSIIHHLDENPSNNQPRNLVLFPSQRHHSTYHQRLLAIQRANLEVDTIQLAIESGGRVLPQPLIPIVFEPDKGMFFPLGKRKSKRKAPVA